MKDEIKEISDNIRKIIKSNREDNFNRVIYDCDSLEKLLDYITTLQELVKQYEDPEDLTLFHMWLDEKAKDKMKQLQREIKNLKQINEEHRELNGELREENERLKIKCDFLANKKMLEFDKNAKQLKIKAVEQIDYKTRNEKAINCINHYATENDDYSKLYSTEEEELLEILQGKSDK